MGTFLLALFIIFIVIPLCRLGWTVYRLRRQARHTFSQFQNDMDDRNRQRQRENRPAGWQTPHKEKKIDRSQGEYIEYEELNATGTTDNTTGSDTTNTVEEPGTDRRIVDVEWEDIH